MAYIINEKEKKNDLSLINIKLVREMSCVLIFHLLIVICKSMDISICILLPDFLNVNSKMILKTNILKREKLCLILEYIETGYSQSDIMKKIC